MTQWTQEARGHATPLWPSEFVGELDVLWGWGKDQAKEAKQCGLRVLSRAAGRNLPGYLSRHILLAAQSPGWPGTDAPRGAPA